MTYRELLNLYKNGRLDAEQQEKVSSDIEKHEAISDFLFENDDIPQLSDPDIINENSENGISAEEKKFQKMIKKSIRNAFIKLGVTVGIIVLALVIAANTALPHIVNAMYYNPAKIIGTSENGATTNQITLDTAVYTELFTPGYYRTHVGAFEEGYGNYDIQIFQNFSHNGQFNNVYGTIEKGKMTLFNDTVFKLPTQNAFYYEGVKGMAGYGGTAAAGSVENAKNKINKLDETDYYVAYVTFDKVMTYDELVKWAKSTNITPDWCAVCIAQEDGIYDYSLNDIIGFNYLSGCSEMGYYNEEYPYLNYYDMLETIENFPEDNFSSEVMTQHMLSMLRYIRDNKEFRDMAGYIVAEPTLNTLIDNIEQHGLNIYGFVITAQKDTILEISKTKSVNYIYTTPLV